MSKYALYDENNKNTDIIPSHFDYAKNFDLNNNLTKELLESGKKNNKDIKNYTLIDSFKENNKNTKNVNKAANVNKEDIEDIKLDEYGCKSLLHPLKSTHWCKSLKKCMKLTDKCGDWESNNEIEEVIAAR